MRERVAGASFLMSPSAFFQTNVRAAERPRSTAGWLLGGGASGRLSAASTGTRRACVL
jgi:hypothetical protein